MVKARFAFDSLLKQKLYWRQTSSSQINLDSIFDNLIEIISGDEFDPYTRKMAEANLKPRIRMIINYIKMPYLN